VAHPVSAQLNYVDSSAGLETPRMEGGRTELEIGDVNGDGHVDIVSIGDHGSPHINSPQHGVMVWFGDGAGSWSVFQDGNFGYGGVALGDVNGDGLIDVGYGMHHNYSGNDFGDQILEVALGDGTGRDWTPWDDGLASNGEDWGMFATDFADVDNDGDLDVGSISFGCCAGLHVYLNNGDGTWTQSWGFLGGNSSMTFDFADVNSDGFVDFACSHGSGTVYLGDGEGGFALGDGNLPLPTLRRGTSLGDVNDDGRDDLAFVTGNRGLAVWSWRAPNTWVDLSGSLPASGSFDLTQIADMNKDGHGDVVAFRDDAILVYAGDGAGHWEQVASVPTRPNTCDYSAMRVGGDVDHNGYPDFAVVAEEDCRPLVGGTNRPRLYREDSRPRKLEVYPVKPRGGETIVAGSVQFLDWTAAVPSAPQKAGIVRIELSLFGPYGPWNTIAKDISNNGRFQWRLPKRLPDSDTCYLRYTLIAKGESARAVTPQPFTVVSPRGPRFADFDGNGRVDMVDVWRFQQCFTGPGGGPIGPECNAGDHDGDGDIDLTDYAEFHEVFTGP